jgi:hypothetical protein
MVESLEQAKTGLRFVSPNTDRAGAITLPSFAVEELRRLKMPASRLDARSGVL